jgi:hypothetical protein
VPRRQNFSPNLPSGNQQLVELQMIVAKAARNRRAPAQIILHKWPHHVPLEALLLIHHVIRNADFLRDAARVVNIVDRAAAAMHRLRHALAARQPALVPELHRQPYYLVSLGTQHRCDGRRIHTARHGNGDRTRLRH